MRKILLTGAAGFIGFHLAQHLHNRGDFVMGIDNFNSYYNPALKRHRAAILLEKGIEVVPLDIGDSSSLMKLVQKQQITHLVHLAAQAGVRYSLECPQEYLKVNIDGFLAILETCRAFPHIPLIYASSSSVYGLNTEAPFSVADRTDHQASLYGVTKKCNELMAHTYHHLFGISCTGLRFFTVYGPWGRPDMAYYRFASNMMQGKEIELYNFGQMERDFTYIDDIVEGASAAIDHCSGYHLFNLGNHRPETLAALVEALESALGVRAKIKFAPMQLGDVKATFADISSSKNSLGFFPKTSLSAGIDLFAKWFLSYEQQNRLFK